MSEQFIKALDGGLYNLRGVKRILLVHESDKAALGILGDFEGWHIIIDLGGIYTSVFQGPTREACEEELKKLSEVDNFIPVLRIVGGGQD